MDNNELNNEWRKVATAMYSKPVDSKILGSVELDVSEMDEFIRLKRRQGVKVTPTHIFTLIIARGLKNEVPELNSFVKRGKITGRKTVDAMVSVLIGGKEMSSVKIPSADGMNIDDMVNYLSNEIKLTREGNESSAMRKKGLIAAIPWPFRRLVYRLIKLITINLGMSIAGISADNYGSFVVANIGTLGLDIGYPALFPVSNVALVVTIGNVRKKPVIINDQVVIRKVMSVGVAMDHRVVDASHGGKLFRYTRQVLRNPEVLEERPD